MSKSHLLCFIILFFLLTLSLSRKGCPAGTYDNNGYSVDVLMAHEGNYEPDPLNDFAKAVSVDAAGNVFLCGSFQTTTFKIPGYCRNGVCNHNLHTDIRYSADTSADDIFVAKYSDALVPIWFKEFGNIASDSALDVVADASGSVYAVGYFAMTVNFGTGGIASAGNTDAFVIKLTASGSTAWVAAVGGAGDDQAKGVAEDATAVYITGHCSSTCTVRGMTLTYADQFMFVAKLSKADGSLIWARKADSMTGTSSGNKITLDSSGNLLIAAEFSGTLMWNSTTVTSTGSLDSLILKLSSSDGSLIWMSTVGSSLNDRAAALAVDGDLVHVVGTVEGILLDMLPSGISDMFVARYSLANGTLLGIGRYGGTERIDPQRILVDNNHNVIVAGGFTGALKLNSRTILPALSVIKDAFIAKFDSSGTFLWGSRYGSSFPTYLLGLAYNRVNETLYAVGAGYNTLQYDDYILNDLYYYDIYATSFTDVCVKCPVGTFSTTVNAKSTETCQKCPAGTYNDVEGSSTCKPCPGGMTTAEGATSMAACSLCTVGTYLDMTYKQVASFGSFYDDYMVDVVVDTDGNRYLTGRFKGTVTFQGTTLTSSTTAVFAMKLGSSGSILWLKSAASLTSDTEVVNIAFGINSNPCIAGTFTGSLNITGSPSVVSAGDSDVFIACFDRMNGSVTLLERRGTVNKDAAQQMTTDSSGNMYLSMRYNGNSNQWMRINGTNRAVVWSGNVDTNELNVYNMVLDKGYLYIAGMCLGNFIYRELSKNRNYYNVYVVQLNATNGNFIRSILPEGSSESYDGRVAVDKDGNVYLVASYRDANDLKPEGEVATTRPKAVVAKYSQNFTMSWKYAFGNQLTSRGLGVSISPHGQVYVAGTFGDTLKVGQFSITSNGGNDVFIIRIDPLSGAPQYGFVYGSIFNDDISAFKFDKDDNLHITTGTRDVTKYGSTIVASAGLLDATYLSVRFDCPRCKQGTYSTVAPIIGEQGCTSCPAGTFSSALGATSSLSCSFCFPGTYSYSGATNCTQCGVGTFAASGGTSVDSCIPCPLGYFSPQLGATACTPCARGYYSDQLGSTSCVPCPKGTYSATTAAISNDTCISAPPGYIAAFEGAFEVKACDPGTSASEPGSTTCTPCDTGYFSNSIATTKCQKCATGSFTSTKGSTLCEKCSVGTYSNTTGANSSTVCTPCSPGYYTDQSGSIECKQAAEGYFVPNTGSSIEQACPLGTYSNKKGASSCELCLAGTYGNSTALTKCYECPAGTALPQIGAQFAERCTPCPVGYFSGEKGSSSCSQCSAGLFSAQEGSTSCEECPAGSFSTAASSGCTLCAAGSYSSSSKSSKCSLCPVGTYNSSRGATSQSDCRKCDAGSYTNQQGSSSCLPCSAGEYTSIQGASTCDTCPEGTYSLNAGSSSIAACIKCPEGTYSSTKGANSLELCLPCPNGTRSSTLGATSELTCIACGVGEYSDVPGASTCKPCRAGTYNNVTRQSECKLCDSGYFSGSGSSNCSPCPSGSFSDAGDRNCTLCTAGTFNPDIGQTTCRNCSAGHYSAGGATSCTPCLEGFYSSHEGSALCTPCGPGTFSNTVGLTICQPCDENSYCAIATKNPLPSYLGSVTNINDPYFAQQVSEATTISSPANIVMIVTVVVAICIALLLLVVGAIVLFIIFKVAGSSKLHGVRKLVALLDKYNLNHYVAPGKSPVNHSTALGGVMSMFFYIGFATVVLLSFVELFKDNNLTVSTTVVPRQIVNVDTIVGKYEFHVMLHNYLGSQCEQSTVEIQGISRVDSLEEPKFGAGKLYPNSTCVYIMRCDDCFLQGLSQLVRFSFSDPLASASVIEYKLVIPHFMGKETSVTLQDSIRAFNGTVFRGRQRATLISISLTTTLYATVNPVDYFFFSIQKTLTKGTDTKYVGYSPNRNPIIMGDVADQHNFYDKQGLAIQIEYLINPNANLIQQQGKITILDFLSKISALVGAVGALMLVVMSIIEVFKAKMDSWRKKASKKNEAVDEKELNMVRN